MPGRKNIYPIVFILTLLVLVLLPVFFYFSKYTKNPSEFSMPAKKYMLIEVRARDVLPEIPSLIKAGDFQRDCNGEENVRIESILKTEPHVAGKVSLNGGELINVISESRDIYLVLRVRHHEVGGSVFLHPTSDELLVGSRLALRFPGYVLYVEITKVGQ